MSSPVTITPFLPGHFEVFNLKPNGRVESVQFDRFHCCTEEPKHAAYDNIENLGAGESVREWSGITTRLICTHCHFIRNTCKPTLDIVSD